MKTLLFASLAVLSVNAFSSDINLKCAKKGALFQLDNKNLMIDIQDLKGNEELREEIKAKYLAGFPEGGQLNINVKIVIPSKNLKCASAAKSLIDCSGSTKKAKVDLGHTYRSAFGSSSISSGKSPVKIENIELRTSLASEGAIVLGEEATTVELNKLKVDGSMFIKMNNGIQLELTESFDTKSDCSL